MIIIKKCYTWYNVFINNHMILKHINENDKNEIEKVLIENNEPFKTVSGKGEQNGSRY